jgi:hypothetical protein
VPFGALLTGEAFDTGPAMPVLGVDVLGVDVPGAGALGADVNEPVMVNNRGGPPLAPQARKLIAIWLTSSM